MNIDQANVERSIRESSGEALRAFAPLVGAVNYLLDVDALHDKRVSISHGNNCVALVIDGPDGRLGAVFMPSAARQFAESLIAQADAAEAPC